jgi:hypothetical protein
MIRTQSINACLLVIAESLRTLICVYLHVSLKEQISSELPFV